MRSKAKTLKNALSEEKVTVSHKGITIVLDGNQQILSLTIQPNLTAHEIEKILPDLLNDGMKKIQKIMVQKMQGMGGFDNFKM